MSKPKRGRYTPPAGKAAPSGPDVLMARVKAHQCLHCGAPVHRITSEVWRRIRGIPGRWRGDAGFPSWCRKCTAAAALRKPKPFAGFGRDRRYAWLPRQVMLAAIDDAERELEAA